jgi:hypothetical protein
LASGADSISPDPFGLGRRLRLARLLRPQTQTPPRPSPGSRVQSPPRPSFHLERNQRLARASASEPGFQYTVAVPLMRLVPFPPCCNRACQPLFQQLLSLWHLTSFTVGCCLIVKGVWGRLTPATVTILWLLLFYYYRTSHSTSHPTSTTETGLVDAPQEWPCRQPYPKDEEADLHKVSTVTPPSTRNDLQVHMCKNPATPYSYKRGGRVPSRQHSSSHSSSTLHSTHIETGTQNTEPPPTHFPKPRPGT